MSDGQHVGAVTDGREETDLDGYARSSAAAMRRLMKPTERARGPRHDYGDGPQCPVPGHGRMFMLGKRPWCPVQEHDLERVEASRG